MTQVSSYMLNQAGLSQPPVSNYTPTGRANTNVVREPVDLDAMFNQIMTNFESSIDDYKEKSESWLYGWALDMEQKVRVNEWQASADTDEDEIQTGHITCPLDGKLTIVHSFEAEAFVPIPNTPFKIQPMKRIQNTFGYGFSYEPDGEAVSGQVNDQGIAHVQLEPSQYAGKQLRIVFYPDINENDIKALLDSYDGTIQRFKDWLTTEWQEQRLAWEDYLANPMNAVDVVKDIFESILDAVVDAWDEIADLFRLLANPTELAEKLGKYMENPELIADMLANAKDEAAKMLTLLKDEARCFLVLYAVVSWFKMLSPDQILKGVIDNLSAILVEVVISLVIPGGAVLRNVNRLRGVAGTAQLAQGV